MITFAVGVAVGIVLSCGVAWIATWQMIDEYKQSIDDVEFRVNELQRDKEALLVDCKETARQLEITAKRLESWIQGAASERKCREKLLSELQALLENNQ